MVGWRNSTTDSYIRYEKVVDPFYLAQQLRGIAYVFYEDNQEVGHWMTKHCQKILTNSRVIIYYLNGDYKTYRFAKKNHRINYNSVFYIN